MEALVERVNDVPCIILCILPLKIEIVTTKQIISVFKFKIIEIFQLSVTYLCALMLDDLVPGLMTLDNSLHFLLILNFECAMAKTS